MMKTKYRRRQNNKSIFKAITSTSRNLIEVFIETAFIDLIDSFLDL